jgi:hypothetical protein
MMQNDAGRHGHIQACSAVADLRYIHEVITHGLVGIAETIAFVSCQECSWAGERMCLYRRSIRCDFDTTNADTLTFQVINGLTSFSKLSNLHEPFRSLSPKRLNAPDPDNNHFGHAKCNAATHQIAYIVFFANIRYEHVAIWLAVGPPSQRSGFLGNKHTEGGHGRYIVWLHFIGVTKLNEAARRRHDTERSKSLLHKIALMEFSRYAKISTSWKNPQKVLLFVGMANYNMRNVRFATATSQLVLRHPGMDESSVAV